MGREASDMAPRPVPLHFESTEFGVGDWRQIAERAVRAHGVVVILPDRQCFAHVPERGVVSRVFRTYGWAERRPALAQAVMAPLICWSFSSSMFK